MCKLKRRQTKIDFLKWWLNLKQIFSKDVLQEIKLIIMLIYVTYVTC